MTPGKARARRERVRKMNRALDRLFPDVRIALHYTTPWELLVAVILSAQCTDKRVNLITEKLFKRYRGVHAYATADPRELERLIYSCGFYRAKTKNIIGAARAIEQRFKGKVPQSMSELLSLPGVARKTANVVLSNAFDRHEGIAVDTHVRRFVIRFDLSDHTDPVRIERDLLKIVPKRRWWSFNHQLVMYGREICPARKHDCRDHPLSKVYPPAAHLWPRAR